MRLYLDDQGKSRARKEEDFRTQAKCAQPPGAQANELVESAGRKKKTGLQSQKSRADSTVRKEVNKRNVTASKPDTFHEDKSGVVRAP